MQPTPSRPDAQVLSTTSATSMSSIQARSRAPLASTLASYHPPHFSQSPGTMAKFR